MPTLNDFLIILPVLVLSIWALLVLLIDLWIPAEKKHITALLSAVGLIAAGAAVYTRTGKTSSAISGMVIWDGFSFVLIILFLLSGLTAIAISHDYLKRNAAERGEYYILLLFSIAGMILMVTANDLIMVFLALELLSIPLYILAGFFRDRLSSEEAALKYFLLGTFSSAFLLFGIAWIYGATGSMNFNGILAAVQAGSANSLLLLIGAALLLVGFGFKIGVFPFHSWVPDVYNGAPTPVSGFMTVATKAAGFAGLLRVFVLLFPAQAPVISVIFWVLAAASMIFGNVVAISQTNIKRLLAYSSIANAGYILMAFVPYGSSGMAKEAVAAALFYLLAYTLTALSAWAVVTALEPVGSEGLSLDDLSGLGRKYPWLAGALLISMLSFTGVPLTMGFWGKFYLFKTAVDGGQLILALIGLLTSLVSAYYYLRVVMFAWFKPGDPQVQPGRWASLVAVLMAAGVLVLSFFPNPLLNFAAQMISAIK